jgi:hypothetical protein
MPANRADGNAIAAVLAAALVVVTACGTGAESGRSVMPSGASVRAERTEPDIEVGDMASLEEAARRQGVGITWTDGPYRYAYDWGGGSAANPSAEEVARVAAFLARELRLYPDGFLRSAGLTDVVLVRDLFVEEDGGARGAAAYIFEDRFFLDVPLAERAVQAGTRVRFIHHLLWHRLDERAGTMWNDPVWEALNPPDFDYGIHSRGGVHETRAGSGSLSIEYPGFLNLYSTGNLPDDKAEVYAYLMVIHSWVTERSRRDEHLRRKVAEIKARLAALDANFDDRFWDRLDADSDDAARYGPAGRSVP